jgi:hypothetical protein
MVQDFFWGGNQLVMVNNEKIYSIYSNKMISNFQITTPFWIDNPDERIFSCLIGNS